jgi:hypothetical protein
MTDVGEDFDLALTLQAAYQFAKTPKAMQSILGAAEKIPALIGARNGADGARQQGAIVGALLIGSFFAV